MLWKFRRSNKGQMYILESVVACILLLTFNMLVSSYITSPTANPQYSMDRLQHVGYDALASLAQTGRLAELVQRRLDGSQWAFETLDNEIGYLVRAEAADIGYNLKLNTISNSGNFTLIDSTQRSLPPGVDVAIVTYYVSGYGQKFNPCMVELNLWYMGGLG